MSDLVKDCEKVALLRKQPSLDEINSLDITLTERFSAQLSLEWSITRQLVSFQANKNRAANRWYKFKEAFSASLVEYLLARYGIDAGTLLDPFAGSGTALFASSNLGLNADGIEVLPIGQQIVASRLRMEREFTEDEILVLDRWTRTHVWENARTEEPLQQLRITAGAYPAETELAIAKYMSAAKNEKEHVATALRFALLCILEAISYTRKDGQYLRWDDRSGRRVGHKPFNKGPILTFDEAIIAKIQEIAFDLRGARQPTDLFYVERDLGAVRLFHGSCLEIMPTLGDGVYDVIVTSPPYCNRYDYTRTYALELALLGIDDPALAKLRQRMLSCTVENRDKDLLKLNPSWRNALSVAAEVELLQTILGYLESQKAQGKLNNNGIPRMVRGYFYEMACVIAECSRVMKPGAVLFMVNDNVRYAGASISVDMILSAIAEELGFKVERILVLPQSKGNSSQQMGELGRETLRKCVYVWRKA